MYIKKEDCDRATELARKYNNLYVHSEALLYVILQREDVREYLEALITPLFISEIESELIDVLKGYDMTVPTPSTPSPSFAYEYAMKLAMANSFMSGSYNVMVVEFLASVALGNTPISKILRNNGFDIEKLKVPTELNTSASPLENTTKNYGDKMQQAQQIEFEKLTALMNGDTSLSAPNKYRSKELNEMERLFLRKSKNSIMILGEPGVGKTNLIQSFVYNIDAELIHPQLKNLKVYQLNIHNLMADIKYHGILEARIAAILAVLKKNPNYVLFIDEVHMLNGGSNTTDIINLLKAPLSDNSIKIIAATTNAEYVKYLEPQAAFTRRFGHIYLSEPNQKETTDILRSRQEEFETFYNIKIDGALFPMIVELSNMYIKNRFNPDKSLDILDSAMSRLKLNKERVLTSTHVYNEISIQCRIPTDELTKNKADQLETLRSRLNEHIIGQNKAFDDVVDTLYTATSGLHEKGRTMGNFLFQGPSSVGKTESTKVIAETLGIPLLRYDMSAYQEKHTVSSLIGSPPGYVGFNDGGAGSGKLITDIEKNPHCVLLLDEIEKAHPEVLNILLQIMDYGKLTSSSGKDVYFSKVILVLTSNLGARAVVKEPLGFHGSSQKNIEEDVNVAVADFLPPEFRARLDGVIMFNQLTKDNIIEIAKNQIITLNRDLEKHKISITIDDSNYEKLADYAIASKINARFVRTWLGNKVKPSIAKLILSGNDEQVTKNVVIINADKVELV